MGTRARGRVRTFAFQAGLKDTFKKQKAEFPSCPKIVQDVWELNQNPQAFAQPCCDQRQKINSRDACVDTEWATPKP